MGALHLVDLTDYEQGYEDGFEGRPASQPHENGMTCRWCYIDGYEKGSYERRELQRANSSNT
ncbi:MAG TPA: hypothetical protein VIY48_19045 [Candidatus Paceibacterota bacterium]